MSPRDPPVLDSRTNFGSVPRGHQEAAFSPGQSVTRRGFVCLPDAAVTGIVRRDDFRSIFPGIFTNSTKITTRSTAGLWRSETNSHKTCRVEIPNCRPPEAYFSDQYHGTIENRMSRLFDCVQLHCIICTSTKGRLRVYPCLYRLPCYTRYRRGKCLRFSKCSRQVFVSL